MRRNERSTSWRRPSTAWWRGDFRWPDHRLIVEVDSWTFHGRTRRAFDTDRARDRQLLREGWRVARFTDRQILADPSGVLDDLADLLTLRT